MKKKKKEEGSRKCFNKNSQKLIHNDHSYHFMIKSKKTTEDCLITVFFGHLLQHYRFRY